jgi:peptide/nickel transport system substrate-binding protein
MRWVNWILAGVVLALPVGARAADFTLALSASATSLDPDWQNLIPNIDVSAHVFDTLVGMDAKGQLVPALAQSWKTVAPDTWEFTLRPGVTFHDGSPLTVDDVIWSLQRPATITRSPASFTIYTKSIAKMEAVDDHTLRVTTNGPYPLLANDLALVFIMSRHAADGVASEAFASGKGMIGTGPFRFVSSVPDDRVVLARAPQYWGPAPAWDKVTLRFLPDNQSRAAALLAGDVDAIENVPAADLSKLRQDKRISIAQIASDRLIYLYLDQGRTDTPLVTAKDGSKLASNPLRDLRVRQALSMAINRDAIRDRLMDGLSYPANNLVPAPMPGNDPSRKPIPYDPDGAKKLLAEAGYPDGFAMTLDGPNNRFVNDGPLVEAIAQMFTRIGIATKADVMPMSVYSTRGAQHAWSIGLIGWGNQTAEASSSLRAIIACDNPDRGWGLYNWSNYCNPKVDDTLAQALRTTDNEARAALLRQAADLALDEVAIIPLHFQASTWGMRRGLTTEPRADEHTLAQGFRPES